MNIQLNGYAVLVKLDDDQKQNLDISVNILKGEIIAVGNGDYLENGMFVTPNFYIGQKIKFTRAYSYCIEEEGQTYFYVKIKDIFFAYLD